MATGTPVVASDLEAFRRVLEDGAAGVLFPVGDGAALATALAGLLADAPRRERLAAEGRRAVRAYDWSTVTRAVVEVYETVAVSTPVWLDEAALLDEDALPDVEDELDRLGDDDPGRLSGTLRRWLAVVTGAGRAVTTVVLTVAVVVLLAVYVTWTAGRLDRLHARVDAAWAALDAQLVRRAAAARAVAATLPPGPEAGRLVGAAQAALTAGPVDREALENDLSRALRAAAPLVPADTAPALVDELTTAATRVGLARSFHNAAVTDTRVVRTRRLVRALHLAGHRVMPLHFDIDDAYVTERSQAGPPRGP